MESNRIKLVPPSMELQPEMLDAIQFSQRELSEFLPWVPNALSDDDSKQATKQAIANFVQFENELRYSIIDKQSERLVGVIGLMIRDLSVPFFEIGYWLRSDCVGLGYITEAIKLVEQYAFDTHNAKRIEIRIAEANAKSRAVAERCGYRLEASLVNERRLPNGRLSNTVVYAKTSCR